MRLYFFVLLLIFSCKRAEEASKSTSVRKVGKSVETAKPRRADHPPIPEPLPSAIEILTKKINDPTKKAQREALVGALNARLSALGLEAVSAAQVGTGSDAGTLEAIMNEVQIDISFHVAQAPDRFEKIIYPSQNAPSVGTKTWNGGGRVPDKLLEDQAQRLIKEFSGIINFAYTPTAAFSHRYVTGASAKDGVCYNGETMTCFPDQRLSAGGSCNYPRCYHNLLVPDNNIYFQHYVSDPPVPAQLFELWPQKVETVNDEIGAWYRYAGRAMLGDLSGMLAPGVADPLHLNVIVGGVNPDQQLAGYIIVWPWDYDYPITYPTLSNDTDVNLVPEPRDRNQKLFPPDSIFVNYKAISDVGFMLDEDKIRYSIGGTLVHEAGHWLGLSHTFHGTPATLNAADQKYRCQIDCTPELGPIPPAGDTVADTPIHAHYLSNDQVHPLVNDYNCNENEGLGYVDTCQDFPSIDPQTNFMNYVSDQCIMGRNSPNIGFTPGQRKRMLEWLAVRTVSHIDIYLPNIPTSSAQSANAEAVLDAFQELHGKGPIEKALNAKKEALIRQKEQAISEASQNEIDHIAKEIESIDATLENIDAIGADAQRAALVRMAKNLATVNRLAEWVKQPKYRQEAFQIFLPLIIKSGFKCD